MKNGALPFNQLDIWPIHKFFYYRAGAEFVEEMGAKLLDDVRLG